jgi:Ca2+:H+ antiporter
VFFLLGVYIVPLAALLGFGTEQVAIRTSQSVTGLLNVTLGNIVEMIIDHSGIALKDVSLIVYYYMNGV